MVADEVGVKVFVAELVAVADGVGVLVEEGNRLGVMISETVSAGVTVISGVVPAASASVGILVENGKGLSEESGATKIIAVRTTTTKMAPRVSIVRTSQKEYRFIAESLQLQAHLSQYFWLCFTPGFIFRCKFKGSSNAQ